MTESSNRRKAASIHGLARLAEAAQALGVSTRTLSRRWLCGQLPEGSVAKLGNVLYFDLEKLTGNTE